MAGRRAAVRLPRGYLNIGPGGASTRAMIPTPQELAAEQKAAATPIVQHHVDLLAARLREARPYGGRYILDKPDVPLEHQKAVVAEFVARGWSAEFVDNQYEGMSFVLMAGGSR